MTTNSPNIPEEKRKSPRRILHSILFFQCVILFSPATLVASGDDAAMLIASITDKITTAAGQKEKSRLYLYRARQHAKLNNNKEAVLDYQHALNSNPAGWILNEYGYFLYHCGKYGQAYKIAVKILEDFPHLAGEAKTLKKIAGNKYREEYYAEHPPTIIMDIEVDPQRVTRHDLIRKVQSKNSSYTYPSVSATTGSSGTKITSKPKVKRS